MSGIDRRRKLSARLQQHIPLPRLSESEEVSIPDAAEVVESQVVEEVDEVFTSSSCDSPHEENVKDPDYPEKRKPRIYFISAGMVSAMDSCKISSGCVMKFLMSTLTLLQSTPTHLPNNSIIIFTVFETQSG